MATSDNLTSNNSNDDEEQILSEMEADLAGSDPRLVDDITSTTVYTAAIKNVKWSILLLLVGIAVMIITLSVHFLFAALGFVIMLVALLILEKSLTKLGKVGLNQIMQSAKAKSGGGGFINTVRKNMQQKFKQD